ncbi:MAG: hypothetical protein LBC89_05865, partial [Bacteroidales bacterium]|nr:hypothetical protein [Bacteroidales bacterium]
MKKIINNNFTFCTLHFALLIMLALLSTSCKKEKYGSLQLNFEYYWGNEKLQIDGTEYNTFIIENDTIISGTDTVIVYDTVKRFTISIENFQFFLSEFSLNERDFFQPEINYFDIKSRNSIIFNHILCKNYPFISFRFGIAAAKNISGIFVNPPERDMF